MESNEPQVEELKNQLNGILPKNWQDASQLLKRYRFRVAHPREDPEFTQDHLASIVAEVFSNEQKEVVPAHPLAFSQSLEKLKNVL